MASNPKYFLLNYTHDELLEILERAAACEAITEEQIKEWISEAQFGDADFTGFAKTEYVDQKIAEIELLEGPQGEKGDKGDKGDQGEVGPMGPQGEQGLEGPQGEKGEMGPEGPSGKDGEQGPKGDKGDKGDKGEDGTFDPEALFENLLTSEKTIVGAINELFNLFKNYKPEEEEPVPSATTIYYGFLPYEVVGEDVYSYNDITMEMVLNKDGSMKQTEEGFEERVSIGMVPDAGYILVAIPKSLGMVAKKDNGVGGQVEFDESTRGANGVEVMFDGVPYLLYGELALVSGERFIYVI